MPHPHVSTHPAAEQQAPTAAELIRWLDGFNETLDMLRQGVRTPASEPLSANDLSYMEQAARSAVSALTSTLDERRATDASAR